MIFLLLRDSSDDGVVSGSSLLPGGVFSIERSLGNGEVVLGGLELLGNEGDALFEGRNSSFKVGNDGVGEEINLSVKVVDTSLESISGGLE